MKDNCNYPVLCIDYAYKGMWQFDFYMQFFKYKFLHKQG